MAAPQALTEAMSSPAPTCNPSQAASSSCSTSPSTTLTTTTHTTTAAAAITIGGTSPAILSSPTAQPTPIPKSKASASASSSAAASSGIFGLTRPPFDFAINLIIPPTELSHSPSSSTLNYSGSLSPIDSSLRRFPTDLTAPIPEECDEETASESYPNEPVTPVSGRQSRDFRYCDGPDVFHNRDSVSYSCATSASSSGIPEQADVPQAVNKEALNHPLVLAAPPPPTHAPPPLPVSPSRPALTTSITTPARTNEPLTLCVPAHPELPSSPTDRRTSTSSSRRPLSRRSSSAILGAMASFFRRSNSHVVDNEGASKPATPGATLEFKEPNYESGTSQNNITSASKAAPKSGHRRFSYHRSVATTRSNTPPSPGSPLETTAHSKEKTIGINMPTARDFFDNNAQDKKVHTGFSLRPKSSNPFKHNAPRRTRSLERKSKNVQPQTQNKYDHLVRQPWALPPEAGTGMKARRLSLSLPDDFTVDVANLRNEFDYQHKFFGRHLQHVGKGATSKVTLMVRKGSPGECYAVKEFRSKKSSESTDEYEKKIKSEYSIAKSLHHPNVVETVRLCTDHGRWNHVMEYCSEGDLFGLVKQKYLLEPSRQADRICLFKQLCQGINYLHENGIAHRDIKLENLLITKDSKLKITDFGVSEVFSGIHPGLREAGGQCGVGMGEVRLCKPGICGSPPYIAPEVLAKLGDYDPRPLDVWSSAIVCVNLFFGGNLWDEAKKGQQWYDSLCAVWEKTEAKKEAKKLENPDDLSEPPQYPNFKPFTMIELMPLRRLLTKMLHPNPEKRITIKEVVTDRWMKNAECCQLESYEDPAKYIDVSKKNCLKGSMGKIYCHNHLPPQSTGHSLPPMPGQPGY
ncbi:kinase-like domain-containing protein [Xylariaceae sp. FL0016]|nr:kinase-like domain-containing protein [Xylariaceae sp. FL0016]